jgi:hypothetical protein
VTLGYALEIWDECTKRFPRYDWILYNNKRLRECDLSESIVCYKDCGSLYLRVSIKGGDKVDQIAYDLNKHCKEIIHKVYYRGDGDDYCKKVLESRLYVSMIKPEDSIIGMCKDEIMCGIQRM